MASNKTGDCISVTLKIVLFRVKPVVISFEVSSGLTTDQITELITRLGREPVEKNKLYIVVSQARQNGQEKR